MDCASIHAEMKLMLGSSAMSMNAHLLRPEPEDEHQQQPERKKRKKVQQDEEDDEEFVFSFAT